MTIPIDQFAAYETFELMENLIDEGTNPLVNILKAMDKIDYFLLRILRYPSGVELSTNLYNRGKYMSVNHHLLFPDPVQDVAFYFFMSDDDG